MSRAERAVEPVELRAEAPLVRARRGVQRRSASSADVGGEVAERRVLLVADRGDDGDGLAATARTTCSSLKGRRSSKLPPPRATTTTSTSGVSARDWSAATMARGALAPWTSVSATRTRAAGSARSRP